MLTSLLLVVDGADADHASVRLAMRWAGEQQALLAALGCLNQALIFPREPVPLGAGQAKRELDEARLRVHRTAIGAALSQIALGCAQAGVSFKPLECLGDPAEEIALQAQRFDLVVLPRSLGDEASPWERARRITLRGILHGTPRPVVAVPAEARGGVAIVVAYDGSLQAARTLAALVATDVARGRPIHVISVNDDPVEAARRGDRAVEFLASHGLPATLAAQGIAAGPAMQIMALADEVDAGLVVLGAYGQPTIKEFFLGSVTARLLEECPRALLLYH